MAVRGRKNRPHRGGVAYGFGSRCEKGDRPTQLRTYRDPNKGITAGAAHVERESSTLNCVRASIESRYRGVIDLTSDHADLVHSIRPLIKHWPLANGPRWVRDNAFDQDRKEVRTAIFASVSATPWNLAVG